MEKILRIEETNWKNNKDDWSGFEGFQIITDEQTIKVGVSDSQSCCESFGCIITNDETPDFIGAEILSITRVDTALKSHDVFESLDCGDVMFINIETTKGLLQFAAYNSHNGYYGHTGVVISKQLNEEAHL